MKTMRAMVLEEPRKMVLKEVPVPQINENEVLIKIKYCGICGSDWGAYTGKYADEAALLPWSSATSSSAPSPKSAQTCRMS